MPETESAAAPPPVLTLEELYQIRRLRNPEGKIQAWLPPIGPPTAELLLVLPAPTKSDAKDLVLAGAEYMNEIRSALSLAGIAEERVCLTALVKHSLEGRAKPTAAEIEAGGKQLEQELALLKPKVVMVLGAEPFKWFKGANVAVGAAQGEFTDTPRGRILVNMSPGMVLFQDPKKRPFFRQAFLLAARAMNGQLTYEPYTWRVVTTLEEHLAIMADYVNRGCDTIGYDAEWIPSREGLAGERLVTFQYSCVPGEAVILDLMPGGPDSPENLDLLRSILVLLELRRFRRVGWNIRADDKRLIHRGIVPPEDTLAFDGMKAVAFLDSRFTKGLETGIRNFTNYGPYYLPLEEARRRHKLKAEMLTKLRWLEPEVFFHYAAGDAVAHFSACRRMNELLQAQPSPVGRDYYFGTYLPLTNYFIDLEMHGIPIDREVLEDLTAKYSAKHAELMIALQELVEPHLPGFNPRSTPQKRELLYKVLDLDPPYWTKAGKSIRPRDWYGKQKPEVQQAYQPSTNNRSLATLAHELRVKLATPPADPAEAAWDRLCLEILECLHNLNRVGVFAEKFLSRRGLPSPDEPDDGTLPAEFPEPDDLSDEGGEPLKQSYWAAMAPDGRIHPEFFECLANFRSSTRPNVQNPASKVLSAIPGIFVPGWAGMTPAERKARSAEVPRNIRHIFCTGDPELLWAEVDVAGADLAIAAFLSGDQDYIQDILLGNFHLKKAREYFRDETITKDDYSRYVSAKAITFRVAYTSELPAAALPIQAEIYAESGLKIPLEDIEYALSTWTRYGRYMQYRQECKNQVDQGCIVNARGIPYSFDVSERREILAGWQNESLAYPIASELALFMWDVAVTTRRELQKAGLWMKHVFPVNSVHDAGYWLVRRDLLKDRWFPEFIKYWFTEGCRIATGDRLGMEMSVADRWKGKEVEFAGETRWDFERRTWVWK
jgi:uracil-DNA glycosylase family 4